MARSARSAKGNLAYPGTSRKVVASRRYIRGVITMVKFIAGMVVGGILAMYPALAYPQQLHNALTYVGLSSVLPPVSGTTK